MTPVLGQPHGRPVRQMPIFRVLLLTYSAMHGMTSTYIRDLLVSCTAFRSYTEKLLLTIPRTKRQRYGDRASLWVRQDSGVRPTATLATCEVNLKT